MDQRTDLRLERVGFAHPDAMRMIDEIQQEYVERYGGPDETPLDPLMFEPPQGRFFVGYVDRVPVASGAWRRRDDVEVLGATVAAEIKRMYVARAVRGRGIARAVLVHLEATVSEADMDVMVLETGLKQPEAMALYESSGYVPVPAFGYYADHEASRYYGKRLR